MMQPRDPSTVLSLLGALQSLVPLVQEHRQSIEQDRRLPAPLFAALADPGLFRLWLPKTLGGPELSPADFMTVVEAAAALDGSIGWVVGNGAGASRVAGYVAEDVARDWFGDQRAFIALATGAVGDLGRSDFFSSSVLHCHSHRLVSCKKRGAQHPRCGGGNHSCFHW